MRLPGEKSTSLYDCSKWERLAAFQDAVKNAGPTVEIFDEILASQRMSIALRDARLALMASQSACLPRRSLPLGFSPIHAPRDCC